MDGWRAPWDESSAARERARRASPNRPGHAASSSTPIFQPAVARVPLEQPVDGPPYGQDRIVDAVLARIRSELRDRDMAVNIGHDEIRRISREYPLNGAALSNPSRLTPIDANTLIYWNFDESSASFANAGSGASATLTTLIGSPVADKTGLFGRCLGCSSSVVSTGNSTVEPTNNALTMSAWVRLRSYTNNAIILNKRYRNDATWTSPFTSLFFALSATGDGSWLPAFTTGGTIHQPTISGNYRIPLYHWCHLAFTYDGSNGLFYIDGSLANTTAASGTIDYGTHGPWEVGGLHTSVQFLDGDVDDIRVESAVRSRQYVENIYRTGLRLMDP